MPVSSLTAADNSLMAASGLPAAASDVNCSGGVVLGVVVGVMLLALYLPIFNLGQAMRSGIAGQ